VTDLARRLVAHAVHRWRRSLQTRVVVSTLVLSALVALLLGVVVLQQIRNGLLNDRARSAVNQLDSGLQYADAQFNASAVGSNNDSIALDIINKLAGRGGEAESYGVALTSSQPGTELPHASDLDVSSIPIALQHAITQQGREAWSFAQLRHQASRHREPGLVVGGPVLTDAGSNSYQLYYLFPLTQESQTLALVQRTMLFAGFGLVLLLAGIAAVVTRQVVRPIRQAAATAERLALGRLRDRVPIHGEDELARLATSFNRMAETVERQIRQLRELSRVQQRFVADVSHELRTPITTIRMAADVLHAARADLPPELARSSELLQTQLDRFETLVADLLEISRHDAGAVTLEAEPTDLRALLTRVLEGVEPLARGRGCTLTTAMPSQPVVVEVDPRRVERVLRNLLTNAIEHGAGEPVEVGLAASDGGVAVTVRDHGVGLRPGDAERVFGRFWRVDPARARSSGGTGLGLSIALEDARLHGGRLDACGEPGSGAIFRLLLPWQVGGELGDSALRLAPSRADPAVPEVTGG
jgi:two-component system sensor histidine kinase MtrB